MDQGRILRRGAARDVYGMPGYVEVASFLGLTNLIPATVLEARPRRAWVSTALGEFEAHDDSAARAGERVTVLIRPDAARPASGGEAAVQGTVASVTFRGARQEMVLSSAGLTLEFHFASAAAVARPGETATIALGSTSAQVLRAALTSEETADWNATGGATDQSSAGVRITSIEPARRPPVRPV
jgi:ABC-type Fe3+/spermidine/putrescine transport system ATPase subunit